MSRRHHRILSSPTGRFYVCRDEEGQVRTGWLWMLERASTTQDAREMLGSKDADLLPDLCRRLIEAMHGTPVSFDDVDLAPGTSFQRSIWRATRAIEAGSVLSYGQLAAHVGRPGAARAVGQAMRRNPQPIITPCHRVISSAGLGGFGGDAENEAGTIIKNRLLRAEGWGSAADSSAVPALKGP